MFAQLSAYASASATLLVLLAQAQLAAAKYTCDTSLGSHYPYCVNVPDSIKDGEKLPTILFLSGSGARGDASNVKSLSGYDGFGKVINQYLSGNKGTDQTMAAEKFITIVPISPKWASGGEARHWWPEYLDKVLDAVKAKYPVDDDQIHCSGYSMGARGCWRYATARPGVLASSSSSAGASESKGDGTLSQEKADPTFNLLDKIVDLPVWQFAGSSDSTAGTESPKKTEAELEKLGSKVAKLTILGTDHSGMSTKPFNADLMSWMLKQRRSGSSDSDDSYSSVSPSGTGSSSAASATATKGSSKKCKRSHTKRAAFQPVQHAQVRRGLTLADLLKDREAKAPSLPAAAAAVVVKREPLAEISAVERRAAAGVSTRMAGAPQARMARSRK